MINELISKFESKKNTVTIVGLGYVGLPLARRCLQVGLTVYGLDVDECKVAKLKDGQSYIRHIPSELIKEMTGTGRFFPTTDFSSASKSDVVVICVPTPLGTHQEPDMHYIISSVAALVPHLKKGQLISLESTTYPGTTDELIAGELKKKGFKIGEDIFVVFSPEREDPGNAKFHTQTIPKVVGGLSANCTAAGVKFYSQFIDKVVDVSSAKVAEMSKLLENIFRSVNIGLVNELKVVCDKMEINIWEVIKAASTKPFGFVPFYPGPGLGGHCIPIDPFYLTWKAREFGVHTRFIELAGQINTSMPHWVVAKLADALNNHGKSVKGSNILVLGVAYKKNIDDYRESPAIEIINELHGLGAQVSYVDPFVPVLDDPHLKLESKYKSKTWSKELLQEQDCILIATDHDTFDYSELLETSKLIVDTRGRYQKPHSKVVLA
jgi:UDP-N-acetyl-D-glucosamine dehydrogenase